MTELLISDSTDPATAHRTVESTGLIADRELVCVQTINIGRLRSDPVPITPACFVAVTGRGPKGDSNASGKTTFLGAVSLLLGDIGWRPASGAPEAASLLFDGTKAGVDVQRYARADHGYIVGVFARPGGTDPLTVWVRLNSAPPYLKARADNGIHLVDRCATALARNSVADTGWDSLPRPEWGSRSYASELYGASPRCMAWLQTRGNETPGKSLLKLAQETMTPAQIGTALLELLGRDDLLLADQRARADLDETSRELDRLRSEDETRRRDEDVELRAIEGRNAARRHLANAHQLWQLHYAKGLVDAITRVRDAGSLVRAAGRDWRETRRSLRDTQSRLVALGDGTGLRATAERANTSEERMRAELSLATSGRTRAKLLFEQSLNRVEELTAAAAGWDGTSIADAIEAAHAASKALDEAIRKLGAAEDARSRAKMELAAAGQGGGGRPADALHRFGEAGIDAVALADELELDSTTRDAWEARLALYADAIVVGERDLPAALAAGHSGDVIVSGSLEDRPLPPGIVAAPHAARPFLSALAAIPSGGRPLRVEPAAHLVVVGGFDHPTTGRAARIEEARRALESVSAIADGAYEERARVGKRAAEAEQRQTSAQAGHDLEAEKATLDAMRRAFEEANRAEDVAAISHREALAAKTAADQAWGGYRSDRARLEESVRNLDNGHDAAKARLGLTIDQLRRRRNNIAYWSTRWDGDATSAVEAVAVEAVAVETAARQHSGEDRSSADAYRRAANHALDRALRDCGIDDETGDGAPSGSAIGLTVKASSDRRAAVSSEDDTLSQLYERQAAAFHELVDALGSWLDRLAIEDEATASHIATDRSRRAQALAAAGDLCETRSRELPILQDQIERTLRTILGAVSDRLEELDRAARGFGADLKIDVTRPTTAGANWEWRATPRYRRGANGTLVPYTERANTATEKLLAIHLVLAALFAATSGRGAARGRVLILDELGDSLGDYHREAVLKALASTASNAGLTVLGTCQDGILEDAANHSGLILYFQFRDPSDILNAPTRVFGTSSGALIELTGGQVERLG